MIMTSLELVQVKKIDIPKIQDFIFYKEFVSLIMLSWM